MKIRTGFVSNSSSSSFLLPYNENNISAPTLREKIMLWLDLKDIETRFADFKASSIFHGASDAQNYTVSEDATTLTELILAYLESDAEIVDRPTIMRLLASEKYTLCYDLAKLKFQRYFGLSEAECCAYDTVLRITRQAEKESLDYAEAFMLETAFTYTDYAIRLTVDDGSTLGAFIEHCGVINYDDQYFVFRISHH